MACVEMSWPSLLVGPSGSGKTCAVRWLANITGNSLREIVLNNSTDATELLGCYEQISKKQRRQKYIEQLVRFTEKFIALSVFKDGKLSNSIRLLQQKLQT